ncbi:MAG TPA: helix-turn-helix domain-containing protein [Candidatus Thermoplasmatota archaeon]|nr:helix-turn-helix domain-containing protein [Candidatus Thermoplasmatota archaeon]
MRDPSKALELESRRRVYQHLLRIPGAHMREIGRVLGMPMGTLEYHLNYLVKAGLLSAREDPRYTRYFPTGGVDRREKDVLAVLRQETPRRIATLLLQTPDASHGEIHAHFRVSASTLSFHLKKLVHAGVCIQTKTGRENLYRVADPELVTQVLVTWRESFLDDVVDRFADMLLGLQARDGPPSTAPAEEQRSAAEDHPDADDDARRERGEGHGP